MISEYEYDEELRKKEWLIEYENEHKEEYNENIKYLFIRLKILMDKKDFEEMARLIKKYNFDIDYNDDEDGNDYLILHASETFNIDGIKFCINNNIKKNYIISNCISSLYEYYIKNENLEEIISIIDYFIENNINIHSIFYNSFYPECSKIYTYLMDKWKHKINFNIIEKVELFIILGGRSGSYKNIKYFFELEEYKSIITQKIINECLRNCISIDSTIDENRYKLIKYLVEEKNAKIDYDEDYNDKLMEKVNKFLSEFSNFDFKNNDISFDKIYAPNIFKKGIFSD
jgi:hypothetical protein